MGKSGHYRDTVTTTAGLRDLHYVAAVACRKRERVKAAVPLLWKSSLSVEWQQWLLSGKKRKTQRRNRLSECWDSREERHLGAKRASERVCFHRAQWLWDTPPPSLSSRCFLCLCFLFIMLSFAEAKCDGVRLMCILFHLFVDLWVRLRLRYSTYVSELPPCCHGNNRTDGSNGSDGSA